MRLAKPVLALNILLASAGALYGQIQLRSGVPVHFLVTEIYAVILNGANGYVIPIPPGPIELSVDVQIAPPTAALQVFVRCGQDVGGANNNSPVFDTTGITVNGTANLYLARPNGGADGNCYIAFEPSKTAAAGIGGRLTATINPLPAGTLVNVPSLASIYLAGQPAGTKFGTLSVPSNSPVQVPISLTAGQGLHILAGGQINSLPPDGAVNGGASGTSSLPLEPFLPPGTGMFGLSNVVARKSALLGVFVGDSIDSENTPPSLDFFFSGMPDVQTLYPMLQQVFYVGDDVTPSGDKRVFVDPQGATRLFLASIAGGFDATGEFVASVSTATIPEAAIAGNPLELSGLADLFLADQPAGTSVGTPFATALMPYGAPPKVPLTLTAGEKLHFRAVDRIALAPMGLLPAGLTTSPTSAAGGLSAAPTFGLVGVFVGDKIDATKPPAGLRADYTSANVQPLLQQTFYIGNGTTIMSQDRTFTVPAGATRLILADGGGGTESPGSNIVAVTPDNPNAPQISDGGIVSNAGFATGPVAAGSMVAIFGTNLGATSLPSATPLPAMLGGTQIYFDTIPAPLFYVSPTQVVAQVPMELYGKTSALVTPVNNGVPGIAQTVKLAPFAAGIFTTGAGDPIITDYNTGALVSPAAPASRGDTLIIWATGIGPTVLDPATGHIAPNAASPASLPINVVLKSPSSGMQVTPPVAYAGLAPGFIGLDQINVQIPQDAPTGTVIVMLQSPGLTAANPVTIGIK
ncbi:MAG TPA: hypothetical protein VMH80_18785 [Bryobacteraceae bacterium]|nr:hypothetical protein [Bryobacteraceae bacterium]